MLAPATQAPAREALTIARIVKVNHAGEFGAIRIYSGPDRSIAATLPGRRPGAA